MMRTFTCLEPGCPAAVTGEIPDSDALEQFRWQLLPQRRCPVHRTDTLTPRTDDLLWHLLGGRAYRGQWVMPISPQQRDMILGEYRPIPGISIVETEGDVSFCHGRYTAPWRTITISGHDMEMLLKWSRNAATGADNGWRLTVHCRPTAQQLRDAASNWELAHRPEGWDTAWERELAQG